jgi:hypothetical protein
MTAATITRADVAAEGTRAEREARKWAKPLIADGWNVEITTEHHKPEFFPDGDLMLEGRTLVFVYARRAWFDGTLHFGWSTTDGTGPLHRRTRFLKGTYYQGSGAKIKLDTYQKLRTWVDIVTGAWAQ